MTEGQKDDLMLWRQLGENHSLLVKIYQRMICRKDGLLFKCKICGREYKKSTRFNKRKLCFFCEKLFKEWNVSYKFSAHNN